MDAKTYYRWLPAAAILGCSLGCTSPRQTWEPLKGEGFPGWNENFASGIRGNKNAQPSGFFTDKKSDQIEKDLGGGF